MSTRRRAYLTEMRTQLSLAVPALLAQVAMISMGFVDMVMTGRVGPVDMAAVALAGSLWVPLVLFGQGLLLAVTPCVAQLRGAGAVRNADHLQGVGHVMRQGVWMALAISVPLILIVNLLSHHLADMGVEGDLGVMTGQYLRAIVWGAPAYLLFVALIPTVLIMALNLNTKLPFGGTTILIIAGVGLDTLRQAKAQTEQFQYAGFLFEDTDHKEGK